MNYAKKSVSGLNDEFTCMNTTFNPKLLLCSHYFDQITKIFNDFANLSNFNFLIEIFH